MKFIVRTCDGYDHWTEYLRKNISSLIVVCDNDKNALTTFLDALQVAGEESCVHLEDDIILTDGFLPKILSIIKERQRNVIQFFSMRNSDLTTGSRWDCGRKFLMGQCFYLPQGYSKLLYSFSHNWDRLSEHPTGLDLMIADFLKQRMEKYWIHIPSLVEHRQCKSRIDPRRSRFRQSKTFRRQ